MDKMLSVQQKKATKQPKSKKKPVKVVYISNPMKVKTSASEFRALVQELTGQDANMPDPFKFTDIHGVGGGSGCLQPEVLPDIMKGMEDIDDHALKVPSSEDPRNDEMPTRSESDLSYDNDTVFIPQMLESFPELVSSNSWFDQSIHTDEFKSLDAM